MFIFLLNTQALFCMLDKGPHNKNPGYKAIIVVTYKLQVYSMLFTATVEHGGNGLRLLHNGVPSLKPEQTKYSSDSNLFLQEKTKLFITKSGKEAVHIQVV